MSGKHLKKTKRNYMWAKYGRDWVKGRENMLHTGQVMSDRQTVCLIILGACIAVYRIE